MDRMLWLGFLLGAGVLLLGQGLEGGSVGALFQGTAALIVFGGTLGATLVSCTAEDLARAFRLFIDAFGTPELERESPKAIAREILEAASLVRKESTLSLELRLNRFTNLFMQEIFRFMVDGMDVADLRSIFETRILVEEERDLAGAKVWMDAGGYAPTIGILGAVLGLIHVMNHITDTAQLGTGIAVAFVATIYGVGGANLVLLPIANKLKRSIYKKTSLKMMILEGACAICEKMHPLALEEKIFAHLDPKDHPERSFALPRNADADDKASA